MPTQRKSSKIAKHGRSGRARTPRGGPVRLDDPNIEAAALLFDMAALQDSDRSRFGYKRAAKAVIALPVPLSELVESKSLSDVPFIGASSARILTEFANDGRSRIVEAAIEQSARRSQFAARLPLRRGFLSHCVMRQVLSMSLDASIVDRAAFRGDFQMHSTWSDGAERIETMAEACMSLGHACMGVTDHSYGLPIARGITMEAAALQQREIDEVNEKYAGRFRVFKGIEANIGADGALDLQPDERAAFEYIVASPHSLLRRGDDQTDRMLAAVRATGVAILGHPRGRMFNNRPGITADWRRVFDAAAERDVAIELDGNWHRQDIDWELATVALEAGCIFALDSDAHSIGELQFTDYALAHARLARIPTDRVINCWSNEKLQEWMRNRRA